MRHLLSSGKLSPDPSRPRMDALFDFHSFKEPGTKDKAAHSCWARRGCVCVKCALLKRASERARERETMANDRAQ